MKVALLLAAVAVSHVTLSQAFAAGFDCAKARTTVEVTICADPILSELDSELNRVYDLARSEHAGVKGDTGERVDPVAGEQKIWVRATRNKCGDIACLRKVYRDRIGAIKKDWQVD